MNLHIIYIVFTMDVSSLYTSIPHEGALEVSKYFPDKRCNKSISTATLLQFIELMPKMKTFRFNELYYSQKQSVAMGAKMGPSISCIFIECMEELSSCSA